MSLLISPLSGIEQARACTTLMRGSEPWLTLGLPEGYEHRLVRGDWDVYVARQGDEVCGFVALDMNGPLRCYIALFAVAAGHRRRGVGRRLLEHAESLAFAVTSNVFLFVSSFNERAQAFYRRMGYRQVGDVPDLLVAGHSELLLRKTRGPRTGQRSSDRHQDPVPQSAGIPENDSA